MPSQSDDDASGAAEALRLGDIESAEELARAALAKSGSLAARLTLAQALAWQGRGREAAATLDAVDSNGLAEADLMAWALPRAANQFFMLDEPTKATAFLAAVRNRVSAAPARATLDALAATFAMNAGTPLRALGLAEEVLGSPHADDVATGWAASAAALSSARAGRFGTVDDFAAQALAAGHPGVLRFTCGFARVTTLLMAGRLDAAAELAQRYADSATNQQPARAIGEVLVAYIAIARGEFDTAVTMAGQAADVLARTGYSWGPLSLMLLAQARGQQGDQVGATKALRSAQGRHGMKSALFAPELALARAWSNAARNDVAGAIDAARDAVSAAERGGQSAVALRALQDAVRLGDASAVYRARRLAGEVSCVVGRLTLAHADALTHADSAAITGVAAELTGIGMHAVAADALRQAAHPRKLDP